MSTSVNTTSKHSSRVANAQIGLFVLAVFYTLYFAQDVFIPIAVAVLFNFVLSPLVRLLKRAMIPPALSAAVVLLGFLLVLLSTAYALIEPANEWLERAPSSLEDLTDKAEALMKPIEDVKQATDQLDALAAMTDEDQDSVVLREESIVQPMLDKTQSFFGLTLLTIILLYFLLAAGDSFINKVTQLKPWRNQRERVYELAYEIERSVSRYLLTVTIINVSLGVITGLAMWAFGVPNPALWGAVACLFNFVPYLGAIMTTLVITFVSFMTFDSAFAIALPPVAFATFTMIEGQLLSPLIHGRGSLISPVVIFAALIVWGWMWGIAGVFLAIPILIVLRVVSEHVPTLHPLFVLLSNDH